MVTFLHSPQDNGAGEMLRRLYETRTLESVTSVSSTNKVQVCSQLLATRTAVVVTDENDRIGDDLLDVLRCLRIMQMQVYTCAEYLHSIAGPPALDNHTPVHANAETARARRGLLAAASG